MRETEIKEALRLARKPASLEIAGSGIVIEHPKAEGLAEYVANKAKEHGLPALPNGGAYGLTPSGEFVYKE